MNAHWRPPARSSGPLIPVSPNAILAWSTGALIVLAIAIGGSSRFNATQAIIIELACLPVLGLIGWRLMTNPLPGNLRLPLAILAATFAILCLQLIPLPESLWRMLPGRAPAAELRDLAGVDVKWSAISLNPAETLACLLALLPVATVFLATALLPVHRRKWLTIAPLAMACVSVGLGALQVAQGADSSLYFYTNSDRESASGLFANRNHQAALLVASLPLAAIWLSMDQHQRRRTALPVAIALAIFLMEIVALVVVKSRAGVLLLAPALVGSLLLVRRNEKGEGRQGTTLLGIVVVIALFVAITFGIGPVLDRFSVLDENAESGGRVFAALTTGRAALDYLPFGSGVGTFVQVFVGYEPIESIGPKFWNHAHNEYLEILLETGLLGLAAMLAFGFWWAKRSLASWREATSPATNLACAGSIVTVLMLMHSTIDYPLRTLGVAVVFAFACGLMVSPVEEVRRNRRSSSQDPRAIEPPAPSPAIPPPG